MAHQGLDRRSLIAAAAASALLPGAATVRAAAPAAATRPRIRRLAAGLDRILAADAPVTLVMDKIAWAEGPLWIDEAGALLLSDPPANILRRWRPGGGVEILLQPSGAGGTDPTLVREPGSNGLARDAAGRLLIANSGGRSVDRIAIDGRGPRTVLVDRYQGRRFNSPNDIAVARDGALYFTDPPYGFVDPDHSPLRELAWNGVYRWRAGGEAVLIDKALTRPNGIGLSPDQTRLYVSVSDAAAPRLMVYTLDARGGAGDRRVLVAEAAMPGRGGPGLPDGLKVARDGTLFCAMPGGLTILSPEGEPLGIIAHDRAIANCAIGEMGRALFLAASDSVFRVPLAPGYRG
ncbi:SMP-30/gluconolactonase/LRE family protein [Sphingomonas morindae]|uniref:SMP-30/gluconolactonase/LRE family protein n=1 Tax=Sphingomonas morindae TaxID=1541170 RepID=A0ABY4XDD1_9SPHN|nr:SMP-30/gluconolactonase/LRE family protein [Sphingomonas morindae]USI74771.1 SMP-30/gluconolactonase/LRE family protein [Sphingomonas morindae]